MKRLTIVADVGDGVNHMVQVELPKTSPVGFDDQVVVVDARDWEEFETGVRDLGESLKALRMQKAS